MNGTAIVCVILAACAAPGPPNQAPLPRLVRPDISLILCDVVPDAAPSSRGRMRRIGFHNGQPMPAEIVCESEGWFLALLESYRIVSNRYLVADCGYVIDLRENEILNSEEWGHLEGINETKVTYRVGDPMRKPELYAFEYATRKLTRLAQEPAPRWYDKLPASHVLSADRKKAIRWENGDELVLYRESEKPAPLGKNFRNNAPEIAITLDIMWFPVLWLDNDRFLTQQANGKLVTVDLAGKVTELVTVKDAPKRAFVSLSRDRSGAIIYSAGNQYFKVDVEKKTVEKSEWEVLGHGFEMSWEADDMLGHKVRYNGKEIGQFLCPWSSLAKAAPGYLALPVVREQMPEDALCRIAVWAAATGKWTILDGHCVNAASAIGWFKDERTEPNPPNSLP